MAELRNSGLIVTTIGGILSVIAGVLSILGENFLGLGGGFGIFAADPLIQNIVSVLLGVLAIAIGLGRFEISSSLLLGILIIIIGLLAGYAGLVIIIGGILVLIDGLG